MRTLEVWLYDRLVGTIAESRKGGRFAYLPEIVESHPGLPLLSLALPVKRRPFGESTTDNWFSGLLPEGNRRQDVCRSLGLSEYDWIGLLASIGWECAGAVRVYEAGGLIAHEASYQPVSRQQLAGQLADISARMPQRSTRTFRMSLGGFQEKMCVVMPHIGKLVDDAVVDLVDSGQVELPVGDAASTHILKPENIRDYPGCAESEAWAMTVASKAARCSDVALLRLDGAPDTLIVERYDRAGENWPDDVARVHQEDVCQALGLPPRNKYATPRGAKGDDPSYQAIAGLLQTYAANPQSEMVELLRQVTVNMAIGNWDAHAKNISFLYGSSMVPTVAPMYDVVPIAEVERRTNQLSLRVDGSLDPASVTIQSLVGEAASWGMSAATASEVVCECLENVEAGLGAAAALYPDAAARHEESVRRRIARLNGTHA